MSGRVENLLRYKTIIIGFAGLSVLLLAGTIGLQLGQAFGGFSVSDSSPPPVRLVSMDRGIAKASSLSTGLKPSISPLPPKLPPKQNRLMVASLAAGSSSIFFNSSRSPSEQPANEATSSGPASPELRDPSVVADNFSIFDKEAPVRLDQSVVMAALKQVRQRKAKRRVVAFNRREKKCLARAIYFESRSEPREGQIAVANVIMNRKANRYFPDTVCRVVNQGAERRTGCQFSFRCDGQSDVPREKKPWRVAMNIADQVMEGKLRVNRLRGVTHYHAEYVYPKWAKQFRRVAKIGKHIFYVAPKIASYQKW